VAIRNAKHLKNVRQYPCCYCKTDIDICAHHLTHIKPNGMSMKSDDCWTVPLCPMCHHKLHHYGERRFWIERNLEPGIYAAILYQVSLDKRNP
jgi:hypothetical protein